MEGKQKQKYENKLKTLLSIEPTPPKQYNYRGSPSKKQPPTPDDELVPEIDEIFRRNGYYNPYGKAKKLKSKPINPSEIQLTIYEEPKKINTISPIPSPPPSPKPKSPPPKPKSPPPKPKSPPKTKPKSPPKPKPKSPPPPPKPPKPITFNKPDLTIKQHWTYYTVLNNSQVERKSLHNYYIPATHFDINNKRTWNNIRRDHLVYIQAAKEIYIPVHDNIDNYWLLIRIINSNNTQNTNVNIYDPINGANKYSTFAKFFNNSIEEFLQSFGFHNIKFKWVDCATTTDKQHSLLYCAELMKRCFIPKAMTLDFNPELIHKRVMYEIENNRIITDEYLKHLLDKKKKK